MQDDAPDCGMIAHARKLAEQVEIPNLPDDGGFTGYMPINLAQMRHECTCYDELWHGLGMYCLEFTDTYRRNMDVCISRDLDEGEECPHKEEAYQITKDATNDAARDAILAWQQRHG